MNYDHCIPEQASGDDPPILFYSSIKRLFRSNFIGYLHQLCLHRKVALLTEELDGESMRLLADTTLFPGLVGQVRIGQYDIAGEGIIARHRRMSRLAREIADKWKPKVVIAPGEDAFENYLRRYAKLKCGAITISCSPIILACNSREIPLWVELYSAARYSRFLPFGLCRALARFRVHIAHFIYYVLAPISVGAAPFFGGAGIHKFDDSLLGNSDFLCVLTQKNKLILAQGGASTDKLRVIPLPLKSGAADILWSAFGTHPLPVSKNLHVLTYFISIGQNMHFTRDGLLPVPADEVNASRVTVIKAILEALPGWEIRIKPHPMSEASPIYADIRRAITGISDRIVWVPPEEVAEKHIMEADAVVVFPPVSAATYSAIIQRPGLPTMVVDLFKELRGDACIGMQGVVTITSLPELSDRLAMLASGNWPENIYQHDEGDFETMEDFVASLPLRLDAEKKRNKCGQTENC